MNPVGAAGGGGGSGGPPPPPGPPLMSSMPAAMGQPFSGSFFVPQQPGMWVCVGVGGEECVGVEEKQEEEIHDASTSLGIIPENTCTCSVFQCFQQAK